MTNIIIALEYIIDYVRKLNKPKRMCSRLLETLASIYLIVILCSGHVKKLMTQMDTILEKERSWTFFLFKFHFIPFSILDQRQAKLLLLSYLRCVVFWKVQMICMLSIGNYLIWVLVSYATFNNISAISWRPVLVVEEDGVPGENHRPWASNW